MKILYVADDSGSPPEEMTVEQWLAGEKLVDDCSEVLILEDGRGVFLEPKSSVWLNGKQQKLDHDYCPVLDGIDDEYCETRAEAVLKWISEEVECYKKMLEAAEKVLAYVTQEIAAGREP